MADDMIHQLTNVLLAYDSTLQGSDSNGVPAVGDKIVRWNLEPIHCVVSIDTDNKEIVLTSSKKQDIDLISRLHRTLQEFAVYSNYSFRHEKIGNNNVTKNINKPAVATPIESDGGTTSSDIASVTSNLMAMPRRVDKKINSGLTESEAIQLVSKETGLSTLLITNLYHNNYRLSLQESIYGKYNKTSYQKIGDSRLVIKHKKNVNNGVRGERSRSIGAIFLETPIGRYTIPTKSLNVARCYAKHVDKYGPSSAYKIIEAELDMNALRKLSRSLKDKNPLAAKAALEAADEIRGKFLTAVKGKPVDFSPRNGGVYPHEEMIGIRSRLQLEEDYDDMLESFVKYNCQESLDFKTPYTNNETVDKIMDMIIARLGAEWSDSDLIDASTQLASGTLDCPIDPNNENKLEYIATHAESPIIQELCKWIMVNHNGGDPLVKLLRTAINDTTPLPIREMFEFERWINEASQLSIQLDSDQDFDTAIKLLSTGHDFNYDRLARRINFQDLMDKNAAINFLTTKGLNVSEGFLPIDYDFKFEIRRTPKMMSKELYEDEVPGVTGAQRQIIKKRAARLAQSILAGTNGRTESSIDDYVNQQTAWSDAEKEFFKSQVSAALGAAGHGSPAEEPVVDVPQVEELPPVASDEPEARDRPARRTKMVARGSNSDGSMTLDGMLSLGYELFGADNINSAPRRSQQSDLVRTAVGEGRSFNWNGHTYTIVGVFGNPSKMNKVIWTRDDDATHVYLTGEKLAMDVLGRRRDGNAMPANLEQFLHGMVKIRNHADTEAPNVTENTGTSMLERKLRILDAIDSQLNKMDEMN